MIEDKDLMKIAHEMDNVLIATCNKYDISPLSLSAVVLARLLVMTTEFGSDADLRKLLKQAAEAGDPDSITLQ